MNDASRIEHDLAKALDDASRMRILWAETDHKLATSGWKEKEEIERLQNIIDALLNHCDKESGECSICSIIICPYKDPLHFHHDGCPSCNSSSDSVEHECQFSSDGGNCSVCGRQGGVYENIDPTVFNDYQI